jgi:hypothetical protein
MLKTGRSQHHRTSQRVHGTTQGVLRKPLYVAEKEPLEIDRSGQVLGDLIDTRNSRDHMLQRLQQEVSVHE